MSARFRVTIHDRQRNTAQGYDVDHIMAMLGVPAGTGETWFTVLRGIDKDGLASAIATLLDRVYEIAGEDVLARVTEKLGRVPRNVQIIDFSGEQGP